MDTIRFILAITILVCAVYVVAVNWGCVIVSSRNKMCGIDRHHSTVPVVSFILVALAHLLYPRPDKNWMIVIPALDIANWSLLALPVVLFREWRKRKMNTEPGAPPNSRPPSQLPPSPDVRSSDPLRTPSSGGCG